MATSGPTNLPAFFSGDADFRTWVAGIHNALASFADLTQTADTGQINPATVARPAVGNAAGYEIWRFNDALQATAPLFFKLEYGSNGAVDRPSLWITAGTGSNGAGGLTTASARQQFGATQSKAATNVLPFLASCEPGRLDLAVNVDVANTQLGMIAHIERSRDAAGAMTGDGFAIATSTNANGQLVVWTPAGGWLNVTPTAKLLMALGGNFTPGFSASGADIAVEGPVFYAGKPCYGLGVIAYNNADILVLTTFAATMLGAARTFMALGLTCAGGLTTGGSVAAVAMRFE